MSVNTFLTDLASSAILSEEERAGINRSVEALTKRLQTHFEDKDIKEISVFGSYSRGTILPRKIDSKSDVDVMIVFADKWAKPQTYLDRLKRFSESQYSTSEIAQSHPTIVLDLHHIRFELVPAIDTIFNNLRIPSRSNKTQDWLNTEPAEFNSKFTQTNLRFSGLIQLLSRLFKIWNIGADRPLESFDLEQQVVEKNSRRMTTTKLSALFFETAQWLPDQVQKGSSQHAKLTRLGDLCRHAQELEKSGYADAAVALVTLLFPVDR